MNDETYTVDEVRDLLSDLGQESNIEVEAELINAAHTNVLLLQQVRVMYIPGAVYSGIYG